jgi:O-antigen/teichoic acid export membrane protein
VNPEPPDHKLDELRAQAPTKEAVAAKAVSGAAIVATRNVLLLVLAFGAYTVLARELSPEQFGMLAIGMAIVSFASTLSNAGLGGALVSSAVPIDEPTLKSVLGLEIVVTTTLWVLIAAVALPFFGLVGQLTAVMALALPIGAFVTPPSIVLERSLVYRTLARIELAQAVVYYVWAIVAVTLGMGVWGVATAVIVRSLTTVGLYVYARRDLFFFPTFSFARVRPLLHFGLKYQGTGLVTVLRDEGLNIGVAAIAGTSVLGIWSLAQNILQLPFLLFQTLWRVSFPATAQLIEAGANASRLIHRGAKVTVIGTGLVLAPLAAGAPGLVPAIFGQRWHESGLVVSISCIALVVSGPVSVATAGYLWASGDASAVLRATIAHSVVWLGITFALLPAIGVLAIPIGWNFGSAVDLVMLAHAAGRRVPLRLGHEIAWPSLAAEIGGAVGFACTVVAGSTFLSGAAGAVVALLSFAVLLMAREGRETLELGRMVRAVALGGRSSDAVRA